MLHAGSAGNVVLHFVTSYSATNSRGVAAMLRFLHAERSNLDSAAREAQALGVEALSIPVDVADAGAVDAAAERIEHELGPSVQPPKVSSRCRYGGR